MYIVLVILRNVKVEYRLDIVNIDTTRRHVRRDQDLGLAVSETVHDTVSLGLLHISVQSFRKISPALQFARELIYHTLGVAEYDGKLRIVVV